MKCNESQIKENQQKKNEEKMMAARSSNSAKDKIEGGEPKVGHASEC